MTRSARTPSIIALVMISGPWQPAGRAGTRRRSRDCRRSVAGIADQHALLAEIEQDALLLQAVEPDDAVGADVGAF